MPSVEQVIKFQFRQIFTFNNWCLFKKLADANLSEAAKLRRSDMCIEKQLKLLARNARKRLLIGVGVELLLKAIYLKHGYVINKQLCNERNRQVLLLAEDVNGLQLDPDNTFTLNFLIENLLKVVELQDENTVLTALKIAKVFRNKEGHGVTPKHTFDPKNYTDIATALSTLYRDAFDQDLSVRFSLRPNEKAQWRLSSFPSQETKCE